MRCVVSTLLACLLVLALGACDYPEQGFFALIGVDENGDRLAYLPFMVDELTDDSHMTIGFTVYLPQHHELIEIPLQNGEDLSRRYWQIEIADANSRAGNLSLELEHSEERLMLSGLYQAVDGATVQEVAGFMVPMAGGASQLVYTTAKPQYPGALEDVLFFEIHPVKRDEFEEFLGTTVEQAKRVPAAEVPDLAQAAPAEEEPEPEPPPPPPKKEQPNRPPPLGGRK